MKPDSCVFIIHKLLKTSQPGKHVTNLTFTAYSPDNRLCPIVCLSEFVKRTSKLRTGSDQLLVSMQKPHKPVSTHTIFRWLKTVLEEAGIDTTFGKFYKKPIVPATKAYGQLLLGTSTHRNVRHSIYCKP